MAKKSQKQVHSKKKQLIKTKNTLYKIKRKSEDTENKQSEQEQENNLLQSSEEQQIQSINSHEHDQEQQSEEQSLYNQKIKREEGADIKIQNDDDIMIVRRSDMINVLSSLESYIQVLKKQIIKQQPKGQIWKIPNFSQSITNIDIKAATKQQDQIHQNYQQIRNLSSFNQPMVKKQQMNYDQIYPKVKIEGYRDEQQEQNYLQQHQYYGRRLPYIPLRQQIKVNEQQMYEDLVIRVDESENQRQKQQQQQQQMLEQEQQKDQQYMSKKQNVVELSVVNGKLQDNS